MSSGDLNHEQAGGSQFAEAMHVSRTCCHFKARGNWGEAHWSILPGPDSEIHAVPSRNSTLSQKAGGVYVALYVQMVEWGHLVCGGS